MKVLTGEVVDGKVVMDGAPLAKGALIAVYVADELDDLNLDSELQAELTNAAAEIARGEFVTPEELFETLRRSTGGARPRYDLAGRRLDKSRMPGSGGLKTARLHQRGSSESFEGCST